LLSIGWLSFEEASVLQETIRRLSRRRLMSSLVQGESALVEDTKSAAEIFERKMRESLPSLP
jgi:hypothetical protein